MSDHRRDEPAWARVAPVVWSVGLALLLLGPALGPGLVLSYDLVWVPDLALRPDFVGLGSGLPRAVPSDAVVAVLDEVLPGQILQKAMLLGCLIGGGIGVSRLVPDLPAGGRLMAISVYQWSPFVAERLLIGHWPVLVAYAVLPWVLLAARTWRTEGSFPWILLILVPLGSLSASAGVATVVALVVAGGGRRLRRAGLVVVVAICANAPWLVSGLLHATSARSDPAAAELFGLAAEGGLPAPLAALTLGGIWNSEVVPPSRGDVLGWLSVAVLVSLAVAGLSRWLRLTGRHDATAMALCWTVGMAVALLTWLAPGATGWLAENLPGGGLLRDGSRMLVLAGPLTATLMAVGATRVWGWVEVGAPRALTAASLVLLPLLLIPDAALGLSGQLRAVDYPAAYADARTAMADPDVTGDVLLLPLSSYRQPAWNNDHKVLDPAGRYLTRDYVQSDELVVSGVTLAGEDPRVRDVVAALALPSADERATALAGLGIGGVLVDRGAPGGVPEVAGEVVVDRPELVVIALADVVPEPTPDGWVAAMSVAWAAFIGSVLLGAGALLTGLRRRRRRGSRANA